MGLFLCMSTISGAVHFLFGAEGNAEPVQGVSLCPDEARKETLTVSFHTILPSDGDSL